MQQDTNTPTEVDLLNGITKGEWDYGYGDSSKAFGIYTKKMLDEGLFEHPICLISPIDKVNDTDKANARLIANAPLLAQDNKLLKEQVEKLQELERSFYMNICRAYNAGKENMSKCIQCYADNDNDNEAFKSSHDYFVGEFPTFKTNVQ